nr:MAG TPA: Protein of unknown function (DUF575) [Caudoviricetes sp.]
MFVVFRNIAPLFSRISNFLLTLITGIPVSSLIFLTDVTNSPLRILKYFHFLSLSFADTIR